MKRLFFAFAAFLFIISACRKDKVTDFANQMLIGTWNQVNVTTKVPTGKYVKMFDGGGMESTVMAGYNTYEVKTNQLIFKGSSGTAANLFVVSSDSLYIEPLAACTDVNGCGTLYARQK